MNAESVSPQESFSWVIQSRALEVETIAALYRELLGRRRLGPSPRQYESLRSSPQGMVSLRCQEEPRWSHFSFDRWLGNFLEEVRAGLGALSFGLGFFARPGSELHCVMLARRNSSYQFVNLDVNFTLPGTAPSPATAFGLLAGSHHQPCPSSSAWWGMTAGDPPLRRHIALFAELPAGDPERQQRLVQAAAIAVWATLRDVLFEFVQAELWEHEGLDPYRLFRIGEKGAAYLFADIRGFTSLIDMISHHARFNDSSAPPTVDALINMYARKMQSAVRYYGRIDKFMGDGVLAVFGDASPGEEKECSKRACQAAISAAINMLRGFTELGDQWKEDWIQGFLSERDEGIDLLLGIGVSYGPASFTFVSTEASRHYTPVGSYVNLAQRLEQEAGVRRPGSRLHGSILASATVRRHGGDNLRDGTRISWVPSDLIHPKGIPFPLQSYWVIPEEQAAH